MTPLLSDNPNIIAGAITNAIATDMSSEEKKKARVGVDYYNHKHDILKNRIFFIDSNDNLIEDKYASNVRIPHSFMTELVDQKTQFLLSNPVEATVEGDDEYQEYIDQYYTPQFQLFLQELVEGGSQKGFEYAYARTTVDDKLAFQVADSLNVIPIYDDNNAVQRVLRYYTQSINKNGRNIKVRYAQLYDNEHVWYFVSEGNRGFKIDDSQETNPAPHVIAYDEADNKMLGRSYGTIPFYRYANNRQEMTDLEPIKSLIDDYDLMDAFLSNNLQDFADALYVVKGFDGDSLDTLRHNLRDKKTIGVGQDGGIDVKTVDIPVEARRTKLELDRANIYKFGFGFDSSQVGDGNVTNVVIKGRYTLLNMKANKTEARLRAFLEWANALIVSDINRRFNKSYDPNDITVNITREMLVNENDLVANEKTEADTRNVEAQTILALAPRLDDETVLRQICDMYGLNYDEVKQRLDEQDYEPAPSPEGVDNGGDAGIAGGSPATTGPEVSES